MFLSLLLLGVSASGSSSQPDSGNLVCSYTKPQDTSNVEVLYSYVNGVLRERYCMTKATTTPPLMTSSGGRMLQDSDEDDEKCSNPTLPYLPGAGYNMLIGMPLPNTENAVDPGYLDAPVFERTWKDCTATAVQPNSGYDAWTVPDTYSNNLDVYFSAGSAAKEIHDEKSFQQEAKSSLTVSGSGSAYGVDMEFTAGSEWSSATKSLSQGETVEQRYTREAGAYTTSMVPALAKLSDAYLKTLTTAFMVNEWSLFFLSYGTHVTTEVMLGARYTQVSMFQRQKYEELKSNEQAYNLGIKASYDVYTGAVDYEHSHSKSEYDMITSSSFHQYIVSNGGDGAKLDAKDDATAKAYQTAAHNFPSPLRSSMLPHDLLITVSKWSEFKEALETYYPDDDKAKSVTTDQFETAWTEATKTYCGDDAHKCQSVSQFAAPLAMTLTTMHYDSPVWGEHQDGRVVTWVNMPDFQDYKAMIKISAIRTFCGEVSHGRYRFRGLQFEYFDGERTATTSILGTKGNSDASANGNPWNSEDNKIKFGEIITGVQVSSGADVDGIWFIVQDQQSSTTRQIGCGYSSPDMHSWNIKEEQRLLAFSGTGIQMDGFTIVKQIQFRSYLYILPTPAPNGVTECKCVTPNAGTVNLNGAACTNGEFHWCSVNQYCTNGNSFPESEFAAQCNEKAGLKLTAPAGFFAAPPAPPSPAAAPVAAKEQQQQHQATHHHKVLLQQIEQLKASQKAVKESNEAAKKDSKHFKWNEAKHQVKHEVKEMSKKMKDEVKEELKDFILKEMKTALGDVHNKQSRLENTVTRMLVHQIESF